MNKSRLVTWFMYALGCAALLCIFRLGAERAFAQANVIPRDTLRSAPDNTGVVNLNTATATELERLPRIGPARAQAILALRAQLTQFSKVEQLLRVKGIGRATFRKLRPMLTLTGPTTLQERR